MEFTFQGMKFISTMNQDIGLAFMALLGLFSVCYFGWNKIIKHRKINRVADGDEKLWKKKKSKEIEKEIRGVADTTAQVLSQIASVAIAAVVLSIDLVLKLQAGTFNHAIASIAFISVSVATICYMFALEQFNVMISPSVSMGERFRLYHEGTNVKAIGFILFWASVLTFTLLADSWVITGFSCLATIGLIYRHYNLRWVRREK